MADVVQRWRVVYRRGPRARQLAQRAELEAWETALARSGLPVASSAAANPRPRLGMPPPLPVGLTGERELLDAHLVERRTAADVRLSLEAVIPPDHTLVELFDVWVGAPPLAAQVVAADYAMTVAASLGREDLEAAVASLLAAARIDRVRQRRDRETAYDLRPFILGLGVSAWIRAEATVWMRLAVHPEQGTGRPDEVLAALGDAAGTPMEALGGTRERLWTADELVPPDRWAPSPRAIAVEGAGPSR